MNNEKPRKCPSGDATVINLEANNKTRETLSASACGFLLLLLLWSFMNIYFSINLYIARSVIRCGYYSVYHVIKLYVMYCSMLACIFSGQGTLSN